MSENGRNCNDLVQRMPQEVAAAGEPLAMQHDLGNLDICKPIEAK